MALIHIDWVLLDLAELKNKNCYTLLSGIMLVADCSVLAVSQKHSSKTT